MSSKWVHVILSLSDPQTILHWHSTFWLAWTVKCAIDLGYIDGAKLLRNNSTQYFGNRTPFSIRSEKSKVPGSGHISLSEQTSAVHDDDDDDDDNDAITT